ncbi:MAG: hypothetical protein ACREEM_13380 [Blastocatellia bacterium]
MAKALFSFKTPDDLTGWLAAPDGAPVASPIS